MGLIAIHELQHRTVFKTRWLNDFFERVYAFISWSDYIWYQESHAIHHRATCHHKYDGEVLLPIRFSVRRWRVWLGLLGWNPKTTWGRIKLVWRHSTGRVAGEWYEHVLPASNKRLRTRHRNWARVLLGGHLLLAAIFILTGNWFLIVVFTFGTFYCGWLGFLCGLPQHYGLNSDVPDFRANTRTFTCSWLPGFYYWNSSSPSNINYFPLFRLRSSCQSFLRFCHRRFRLEFRSVSTRFNYWFVPTDLINVITRITVPIESFQEPSVTSRNVSRFGQRSPDRFETKPLATSLVDRRTRRRKLYIQVRSLTVLQRFPIWKRHFFHISTYMLLGLQKYTKLTEIHQSTLKYTKVDRS